MSPKKAKLLTADYFQKHNLIFIDTCMLEDIETNKLVLHINAHGRKGFFKLKMDDASNLFHLSRKTRRWTRIKKY
ncbi:hypothetical protein JZO78_04445 [Enterococcus ureilyticus]|uniref:hypothetical protein n=1 Tax=Enterococcus ureilyticus TaxID=1131292 RepID=UPI001A930FFE|nr:hypothetical protein [Enterococcus ureilyticus]MBO0445585.1 hypothetical protein [Enterococcus ureilyticus]